jgi:hypothetical protein
MQDRIAQLRADIAAKEAYGIRNLGRAYNELGALEWAAKTPLQRAASKVGTCALIVVGVAFAYGPLFVAAYNVVKYFFVGG